MELVYGIAKYGQPIELCEAIRITGLSREELSSLPSVEIITADPIDEELIDLYNKTSI